MKLILIYLTIVFYTLGVITCDEEPDEATDLNEANFDDFISKNKITLVKFFAPWCGHCKRLKPIYSEVSKMLKDDPSLTEVPVSLAKVDVTIEKSLGEKYKINAFPTLMFFRENYIYQYEGPFSDAKSILSYLKQEAKLNWEPPKSMVVTLSKNNFTEWVEKYDISLVEFYSPGCGHCQRLEPEYEKAAKILSDPKKRKTDLIHLAKVDGSIEFELREKYQITGYPTMFVFRKGRKYEYNGGRSTDEIVKYMEKQLKQNSKEIKTFNEFKSEVKNPTETYIIGIFNNQNDDLYHSYINFASRYPEDFKMFHSFDVLKFGNSLKLKLKAPSIIVYYHDFIMTEKESNFRILDKEDASANDIEEFVIKKSLPLIGVLNQNNVKHIYKNTKPICYAFYQVDFGIELRKNTIYFRNKLIPLANKYKNIKFVIADEQEHEQLINKFDITESKGDVTIVCLNEKSEKFIYDNEDSFDTDDLKEFIEKFVNNKLKPHFKTETEPKNNANKLVKVLVGSTFVSTLENNNDKDILIYFYKKDSVECVEFDKIYSKLAKKYTNDKKLLFTKINADNNEYPDEYSSQKYPALFYIKGNNQNKNDFVKFDYSKEANLEDLNHFVEENKNKKSSVDNKQEL